MSARRAPAAARASERAAPTVLAGVGPARAARLARAGLASVRDLLFLIPRRVERWDGPVSIAAAREGEGRELSIRGRARSWRLARFGGRRSLLRVEVEDGSGAIEVLFFNQPWLRERFAPGAEVEVHGKVVRKGGPALAALRLASERSPLPPPGTLVATYPAPEGLGEEFVRGLCRAAAQRFASQVAEPLEARELALRGLPALPDALRELHEPRSLETFEAARRRVALEPLLRLQARLLRRRERRLAGRAVPLALDDPIHNALLARFPFAWTRAQASAAQDLRADLARSVPMRRLLQGDVGSGKTAVGLYACMAAAACGAQAAFLAPTELLAEQHFAGERGMLERAGVRAGLLTGSLPPAARRRALEALASGATQVVFGTHALLSGDVAFAKLALAVIDEQHRFGVAQRQRLLDKGADVHALLMTATPIPRTLATTVYGDLDVTTIGEKPPGRGGVTTRWLKGPETRRLPGLLVERLAAGERAFWVVPRIEETEKSAGKGAEARFAKLSGEAGLARFGVELVHGRLPAEERAQRIERFRRGETRLLVATTVIEVGVDVPEATAIVIEEAQRLGIAQLHQLRGRVGRSARPSWCWLIGSRAAADRFQLLERESDGFALAEEDLRQRGMGDLVGLRQAGANAEGLADFERDLPLLLLARDLLAKDAALRERYALEAEGEELI